MVFTLTLKLVKRLPWNTWVVFGIHVLHVMTRTPATLPFSNPLVSDILEQSKRNWTSLTLDLSMFPYGSMSFKVK